VIDTIANVQRAYWDLVFAIRNEQIQREAVQLARVQLENNLRQVEAGTLAPIELRSTESDLEARKVQVIAAMQTITQTENTLKNLMLADSGDTMWTAALVPVDPADLVPVNADLDSAVTAALPNRRARPGRPGGPRSGQRGPRQRLQGGAPEPPRARPDQAADLAQGHRPPLL